MKTKKIQVILSLLISLIIVSNELVSVEDDLARVTVLQFFDDTNSNSFKYLSASIADAIDKSMHAKFEYANQSTKKGMKVAKALLKKRNKINKSDAAKICKQTQSDILLFGRYTHNNKKQLINIFTGLYLVDSGELINLKEISNPVDASLFGATDKVAALIVKEITKIATAQQNQIKTSESPLIIVGENKNLDAKSEKKLTEHIKELKSYMANKYKGNFISYKEYKKKDPNIPPANKKQKLYAWMKRKKITNSYTVVLQGQNFTMGSVKNGVIKKKISYSISSTQAEREAKWEKAAQALKIPKNKNAKKKLIRVDGPEWQKTNWEIGVHASFLTSINATGNGLLSSVYGQRQIWKNFYGGFSFATGFIDGGFNSNALTNGIRNNSLKFSPLFTMALFSGYGYNITPRWQLFGELSGGYYYADYSDPTLNLAIKNPMVGARIGGKYLVSQGLSIGLHIEELTLFDTKPLLFSGGGFTISSTFDYKKEKYKSQDKKLNWNRAIWQIGFMPQVLISLNGLGSGFQGSLFASRRIWQDFYGKFEFSQSGLTKSGQPSVVRNLPNQDQTEINFDPLSMVIFSGGYNYTLNKRAKLYGELGVGYYWAQFKSELESFKMKNPLVQTRIGIDYLLTQYLSAGVNTSFSLLYDAPSPLLFTNVGVSISSVISEPYSSKAKKHTKDEKIFKQWQDYAWELAIIPGMQFSVNNLGSGVNGALYANRRVFNNFYIGGQLESGFIKNFPSSSILLNGGDFIGLTPLVDLVILTGYFYQFTENLQSYFELGAGYAYASFETPSSRTSMQNPIFMARLGAKYRLLDYLILGGHIESSMLYDKPTPLIFPRVGISVSVLL